MNIRPSKNLINSYIKYLLLYRNLFTEEPAECAAKIQESYHYLSSTAILIVL